MKMKLSVTNVDFEAGETDGFRWSVRRTGDGFVWQIVCANGVGPTFSDTAKTKVGAKRQIKAAISDTVSDGFNPCG